MVIGAKSTRKEGWEVAQRKSFPSPCKVCPPRTDRTVTFHLDGQSILLVASAGLPTLAGKCNNYMERNIKGETEERLRNSRIGQRYSTRTNAILLAIKFSFLW